ncbi:hypothetical protein MKW92_042004, partial [Papaver armeniacum]
KLIGARYYEGLGSARDTKGHGTHTASTAAGNIKAMPGEQFPRPGSQLTKSVALLVVHQMQSWLDLMMQLPMAWTLSLCH